MTRVLVAGGGIAGVAAAVSASKNGARATIAEGSPCPFPDKSLLPRLLSGESPPDPGTAEAENLEARFGIEVRYAEPVVSVDPGSGCARTSNGRLEFDRLVLATGSAFVPADLRGSSKLGVFTLRCLDDYLVLSRAMGTLAHVALAGPLPFSLIVAEAISRSSRVSVFLGSGPLSSTARRALGAVSEAASARGVTLLCEPIDAIVGVGARSRPRCPRARSVLATP